MDPDPLTLDRALALESVKATITGVPALPPREGASSFTDGGRYAALGMRAVADPPSRWAQAEERIGRTFAAALDAARRAAWRTARSSATSEPRTANAANGDRLRP